MEKEIFNEDYFENGIISGTSCYVNYRWMPELTIKMAYKLVKKIKLKEDEKILDFGCAKGYLVKALRILDFQAYGCDISEYAIKNLDPDTKDYCELITNTQSPIPFKETFDWIITKDVLEHLNEKQLDTFLKKSFSKTKKMFHVIPLGDENDQYIVPEYALDKTHILAKDEEWWKNKFKSHGWNKIKMDYKVKGIKDNWTEKYKKGNAFFILEK